MNRLTLVRLALASLLAGQAGLAAAQYLLEVIALRHRTAEQVLPALRPLLEPGATLSGQANQLIVRASPANLADIRAALESIDRPLRRLQISVRFDDAFAERTRGFEAGGTIGNRGSRVEIQGRDASSRVDERVDQRLLVLEGSVARIQTGVSRPVQSRQYIRTPGGVVSQEVVVVQDLTTGFEVVPRLAGSQVLLDIAPQRENVEGSRRTATTISTRLGEWTEIGAITASTVRDDRGIASASRSSGAESRRIWVKVEEQAN
jgi:type II secretory pathway component GspD/PulD (secretin)